MKKLQVKKRHVKLLQVRKNLHVKKFQVRKNLHVKKFQVRKYFQVKFFPVRLGKKTFRRPDGPPAKPPWHGKLDPQLQQETCRQYSYHEHGIRAQR